MTSNLERNLAISRLCKDIISINEKIHSVISLNKNGRVIESEFSYDQIISKMSKSETEMLYMQRTLQTSLSMEFDNLLGPLNYMIFERETMFEFIFPFSEGVLFITCDLDIIPRYLSKKILFILNDFDWRSKNLICKNA